MTPLHPGPVGRRRAVSRAAWCLALLVRGVPAFAQQTPPDLSTATLEDLMNIKISSADRKPESVMDTSSAVYVITADDIRRSGLSSVPELLRLAPGVQVARIDSNKWAIAVRGFNFRWSNKLLVMVDGRSVYNRLDAGVNWDMVAVPPEDIDRIEVVRGPGGSVWGTNAVDGVINILTKAPADTRGGLVHVGAGDRNSSDVGARYGGSGGRTTYRLTGQWFDRGYGVEPGSRQRSADDSHAATGGFRLDWTGSMDTLTVQGDILAGASGSRLVVPQGPIPPAAGWPLTDLTARFSSENVLARWKRTLAGGATFQAQTYVDHLRRREVFRDYSSTNIDVDLQFYRRVARHQLLVGTDFRRTDDRLDGSYYYQVTPAHADLYVVSGFAQDEMAIARTPLSLTVGSKLEHETLGGWSVQPTARLLWAVSPRQRAWFAVSRAVRTPARVDRGLAVNVANFINPQGMPVVVALEGSADYQSEELQSVEAGYRVTHGKVSLDATVYASHHERLQTQEAQPAQLRFDAGQPYLLIEQIFRNDLTANTRGVETTARWQPASRWQVEGSVSAFHVTPHLQGTAEDSGVATADANTPAYQWQLRTWIGLGSRVEASATVWGVGGLQARQVPAYTRIDLHAQWTPVPHLTAGLYGQNLSGAGHVEFGGIDNAATPTLGSRRVTATLAWRF